MATCRILVADDEPLVREIILDSLERLPASVLMAQDGEETIRLAKAELPDLILLDVMMPGLDGFQVAERLKQEPATAEIPVIFISVRGAPKDKVRGLNLGAEDYLSKPIDPEELRARVQMVLRRTQRSRRDVPMVSGKLEVLNLLSLIQMFEGERRTARLLLSCRNGRGEIVFEDGKITRAAQGARLGKAAIYQLLTWQEGTFEMAPPEEAGQVGGMVDARPQALLMEGMRRLDGIPGLRAALADPPMRMEVPADLRAAIQGQALPEAAAVAALLDGTRDLDQVLAQSPVDDWATLRILDSLRRIRVLGPSDAVHERRRAPRLSFEAPIECQSLRSSQKSTVSNLSAHGVFICTAVPFDLGEQVVLRFHLPGNETPIKLMGQVMWRNADPGKAGEMGMGIRFVEVTAGDREAIERYLVQAIALQLSMAEEEEGEE